MALDDCGSGNVDDHDSWRARALHANGHSGDIRRVAVVDDPHSTYAVYFHALHVHEHSVRHRDGGEAGGKLHLR